MYAVLKSTLATLTDRLDRLPAARFYTLLAGVALLVEALWVFGKLFLVHLPDAWYGSESYDMIARNLIHHGRYSLYGDAPTGYRPPLYPLFLAAMIEIFGRNWITGTILTQAALFLVACLLLALGLQRLFADRLAVLLGVLLMVTDVSLAKTALVELETALFVAVLMAFFYVLIRDRWSIASLAALSALAALAHLTRPTGLLVLPSLLLVFWSIWRRGRDPAALARSAAALALPFIILVAPWQFFLYRELKTATLLSSTAGGYNLYHGNNPDILTMCPYVWLDDYNPWMQRALVEGGVSEADEVATDKLFSAKAFEFIKANPGTFLKAAVIKFVAHYSPLPMPLGYGDLVDVNGRVAIMNYRPRSTILNWFECPQMSFVLLGALLFSLNAIRGRGPRAPALVHIWIFLALSNLMQVVTVAATVYRVPLDPLFILLAAGFYAGWARRLGKRAGIRVAGAPSVPASGESPSAGSPEAPRLRELPPALRLSRRLAWRHTDP
jgi:4-amino-4-deoxy-L-arabinose transferase-like glycosyltransferase